MGIENGRRGEMKMATHNDMMNAPMDDKVFASMQAAYDAEEETAARDAMQAEWNAKTDAERADIIADQEYAGDNGRGARALEAGYGMP
jgi:hypothetical protein